MLVMMVVILGAMVALGQLLDLVDQGSRAVTEAIFRTLVDRPIAERRGIQRRLDIAGQTVSLVGDIADLTVEMSMTVPAKNNSPYSFNNPLLQQVGIQQPLNKPSVDHVDLITGKITGVVPPGSPNYAVPNVSGVAGAAIVYNPTTTISQQIHANNMRSTRLRDGSTKLTFTTTFTAGTTPSYIRARGTNIPVATPNVTDSAGSPVLDINNSLVSCTDPACPTHLATLNGVKKVTFDVQAYSNVWFYANPIFIRPEGSAKLLVEQNADLAKRLAERADNDRDDRDHDRHDHDDRDHDGRDHDRD
jgi:hypothetical protein